MSNSYNSYNSDTIIKQKLEGYEVDFPMEIWDNIDVHRSFGYKVVNKLKRNWYLLPVLLVGFSFLLFWWMSSTPNQQGLERASLAAMTVDNTIINLDNNDHPNGNTNKNKNVPIAIETDLVNDANKNLNTENELKSKVNVDIDNVVKSNSNKSVARLNKKDVKADRKSDNNDNRNDLNKASENGNFTKDTFVKVSENNSFNDDGTIDNIDDNDVKKEIFENKTTLDNEPILKDSEEKILPKKEEIEKAIPANLQELELAFLSSKPISTPIKKSLVANAISDDGCNNFGSRRYSNFMVDFLVGPDYSFKNLSLRNTEPTDYLGLREETESMVVGFSGQARFTLLTPSNIMLRS